MAPSTFLWLTGACRVHVCADSGRGAGEGGGEGGRDGWMEELKREGGREGAYRN